MRAGRWRLNLRFLKEDKRVRGEEERRPSGRLYGRVLFVLMILLGGCAGAAESPPLLEDIAVASIEPTAVIVTEVDATAHHFSGETIQRAWYPRWKGWLDADIGRLLRFCKGKASGMCRFAASRIRMLLVGRASSKKDGGRAFLHNLHT